MGNEASLQPNSLQNYCLPALNTLSSHKNWLKQAIESWFWVCNGGKTMGYYTDKAALQIYDLFCGVGDNATMWKYADRFHVREYDNFHSEPVSVCVPVFHVPPYTSLIPFAAYPQWTILQVHGLQFAYWEHNPILRSSRHKLLAPGWGCCKSD